MPFTDFIGAEDVPIPEEEIAGLIAATVQQSAALTLGRTVPMSSATASQRVLSELPDAYWVDDGGLKETSKAAFEPLVVAAAEIAVVVPIEENTFNDAIRKAREGRKLVATG